MARRTIDTATYHYVISPDLDLPVSQRIQEIVGTQLVDELNGGAPVGYVQLQCDNPNLTPRVGSGGFAGLVGIPLKAVPLLNGQSYSVTLSVKAEDYLSDSQPATILSNLAFPGSFTPLDIGVWPLHRLPVQIYGTVNLATATGPQPVPGAAVTLAKLWRRVDQPPAALVPLALTGPLGAARPAGAQVQANTLTPTGSSYNLVAEAQPGATSVLLSNTVGLAPADVLAFDTTDPDRTEYATVTAISGAVIPTQPATVTLALPLSFLHAAWTAVLQVTPAAAGPPNSTGVDGIAGDGVLLLNQPMTGINSGSVVAIGGGAPATEYRIARVFNTVTDAVGNYRLPPLSRVAQLELTANDGVHAAVPQLVIPQYRDRQNRVDFLMS